MEGKRQGINRVGEMQQKMAIDMAAFLKILIICHNMSINGSYSLEQSDLLTTIPTTPLAVRTAFPRLSCAVTYYPPHSLLAVIENR